MKKNQYKIWKKSIAGILTMVMMLSVDSIYASNVQLNNDSKIEVVN